MAKRDGLELDELMSDLHWEDPDKRIEEENPWPARWGLPHQHPHSLDGQAPRQAGGGGHQWQPDWGGVPGRHMQSWGTSSTTQPCLQPWVLPERTELSSQKQRQDQQMSWSLNVLAGETHSLKYFWSSKANAWWLTEVAHRTKYEEPYEGNWTIMEASLLRRYWRNCQPLVPLCLSVELCSYLAHIQDDLPPQPWAVLNLLYFSSAKF